MNLNKNISIWRGDSTPPTNYHFWIKSNGQQFTFNGEKWVNYVEDIPTASLESKGLMSSQDKAALDELPNSISEAEISSISNTQTANDVTIETHSANQILTTTIPCATSTTAGVMSAEEKVALDNAKQLVNITYDELKSLRDSSKLIPGMQYRITDYEFTTLNPQLKAKPSTFDIIVTADDDHTLNENARAVRRDILQVVTKLNVIDIDGEYAGMVDDFDYYEYEDVMEIDGVVYYKWRKNEEDVTDYFILTDTRIFEGVTAESPYTPIGYGWTDADGQYSEGGSHPDKAVFPADDDVVGPRDYAAWELKYTIDNVLWSASKGQWILTDDEMEFERVGTIEIDGKTYVLWYNKDFDPGFGEGETKGYYASHGEVESNDTALALVDIENKRIVSEDYGQVSYCYKGDSEGKGTILWLKDEYRNSAYYDHHNVLVRNDQGSEWFPTFAADCYDNIIGPYNHKYTSRFEQIGVNIFYRGCYCNRLDANNEWNTFGDSCNSNTFGDSCTYNTFGTGCDSNTFGQRCTSNTFGDQCTSNTFGNYCKNNRFGNYCASNTFGNYCYSNTFDYGFDSNTFFDKCYSNKFGNNCIFNTFGYNCASNTFGNNCYSNRFDYKCHSNKFGNYCNFNTFGDECTSNTFGNKCTSNTFGYNCYLNTFGNGCTSNTFGYKCYSNRFDVDCRLNTFGNNCNSNTFGQRQTSNTFGDSCYSNTFGDDCKSNTFSKNCYSNTFGNNCTYNTFGNGCTSNTFGNKCTSNTFGDECTSNELLETNGYGCNSNTFSNNCSSNTLGYSCNSNTFGDGCNSNKFSNTCRSNTFGDVCISNTFSPSCQGNKFGNNCNSNTFGTGCYFNKFGNRCASNTFGSLCNSNTFGAACQRLSIVDQVSFAYVLQSTNSGSDTTNITINFLPNKTYCQYAGYNSSGELKIWVPADLVQV